MKRACEDTLEEPDDKVKQKKLEEFDEVMKFVETIKSELIVNNSQPNDVNVEFKDELISHPHADTAFLTEKDPELKIPENISENISTSSKDQINVNANKTEEIMGTPQDGNSQHSIVSLSSEDQSMFSGRFKNELNNNQTKDDHPPKHQRRGDELEEIRLLIPSQIAGAVIGKGGGNIQKLRNEFNVKVNIVDCRGPERIITISSNMDTCCNVIREIMKHFEPPNNNELDLRILLHQSLAGCVIGRLGVKIKEIRDRIGCKLKIFPEPAPQSTDRVAQIIGNEIQCIQTLVEIFDIIRGHQMRGQAHNYDPRNFDEFYAESYGGFGVPGKIMPARNVRDRNRNNVRRAKTPRQTYNRNNRPFDYVNPWAVANNTVYQTYSNNGHMTQMNPNGYGQVVEERTTTQVSIPRDLAGALIGKRGERIKRIRNEVKFIN